MMFQTNSAAFAVVVLVLVLPQCVLSQMGCPLTTTPKNGIQECTAVLGSVNKTLDFREEVCRLYSESIYCIKRFANNAGLTCSLQDIITAQRPANFAYQSLSLAQCAVAPATTSFCRDAKRVYTFSFISCRPYLEEMSKLSKDVYCMYSKYLVQCINEHIRTIGMSCSEAQITKALTSPEAGNWMWMNYPGVKLAQCLLNGTADPVCVDPSRLFSFPNLTTCMSSMLNLNLSAGVDVTTYRAGCSTMQEIMACMVHEAKLNGTTCTMANIKTALTAYLKDSPHLAPDMTLFGQCAPDKRYMNTSICKNTIRLSYFISAGASKILMGVNMGTDKELSCTTIDVTAQILLGQLGLSCTPLDIFTALATAYGRLMLSSKYPNIDIPYCANRVGAPVAPMTASTINNLKSMLSMVGYGANNMRSRKKRNAVAVKAWLWKDNKVPFVIEGNDFSGDAIDLIMKAIKKFNTDVTCIQFTPRVNEFDYVKFQGGMGCLSSIGRDGGEQAITIGRDCYYMGVILHEMTHAIGFFHEQNRWDRDEYVTIHWNNVLPGKEYDFSIQEKKYLDTLDTPYDFGSIMHYGPYVFSKDSSSPTISPKFDPHVAMGQRDGFSELDLWKISKLYGCAVGPPPQPEYMKYRFTQLSTTTTSLVTFGNTMTSSPLSTSSTTSMPISTLMAGVTGKPHVLVSVFPHALRINWDQPTSTEPILGYIITYKLEPAGRPQQVRVSANRLAYYLSTYSSHPGRRYTVTIAAVTQTGTGPVSDPVTVRSACSKTVYLDNETYSKIHSPFYKDHIYEPDVVCQWHIKKPETQHLNFTFTALDLQTTEKGCGPDGDYVLIGNDSYHCDVTPSSNRVIIARGDVTVTFVSKIEGGSTKHGGFAIRVSAQSSGYAPENLEIKQLISGFNVTWQPPVTTPSQVQSYVVRYKLASDDIFTEITLPAQTLHFPLSTYPHYGREYNVAVFARFANDRGDSTAPMTIRSRCARNITVTGPGQHLNSPHFPNRYEPDTVCQWNIFTTSGHRLVLHLEQSIIGNGDFVDILSQGASVRLDKDHNQSQTIALVSPVNVIFSSDSFDEATGFKITLDLSKA